MNRYWFRTGLCLVAVIGLAASGGKPVGAATPFIEQFDRDLAASPLFEWLSSSSLAHGTANLADPLADDDTMLRLDIGAAQPAGPVAGADLVSKQRLLYGTYEARLKTAACPNTEGVVNGFFTYFNDGSDSNGNGLPDNSEIDFEWLCAEPQSLYLTIWTDYDGSDDSHRRVYRKINLATGQIAYTRYATTFGDYTDLTGAEASPASVAAMPDYAPTAAYYEYGFTWAADRVTLWLVDPADGRKIILWDYRGPAARIPAVPAAFMVNLWHTATWAPECCPNALSAPAATRQMDIDWLRYTPPSLAAAFMPLLAR